MADIPATPDEIRAQANDMSHADLLDQIDEQTRARIDTDNRVRVQRAWEVLHTTGQGLAAWQAQTPPPVLPSERCVRFRVDIDTDMLNHRIAKRFDLMLEAGALDEVAAVLPDYDPNLPAHRAIGVPELVRHLRGEITLDAAREAAIISTRQYAKRQRTWARSKLSDWQSAPK